MSIKEKVAQDLQTLNDAQLQQVAQYLAFLKFQSRGASLPIDDASLASLYAEFADEDSDLAEQGIKEYAAQLTAEDAR